MTNRYVNPQVKPPGAKGPRFSESSAPMKPDRFTTGGHTTPNHNPTQPHLGLPKGSYTHAAARKAVHEQFGVKEAAPARKPKTQASLETPKPEQATKAKTQDGSRSKASVKPDSEGADTKGFPKGKE